MKAQHVSSGIPLIIRSSKLYLQPLVYIHMWWPVVVQSGQPGQRQVTTWVYKPEAANTVWSSWWWAVCRSKHVEPSINFGIIKILLQGCILLVISIDSHLSYVSLVTAIAFPWLARLPTQCTQCYHQHTLTWLLVKYKRVVGTQQQFET
jgi:hypothetical protein